MYLFHSAFHKEYYNSLENVNVKVNLKMKMKNASPRVGLEAGDVNRAAIYSTGNKNEHPDVDENECSLTVKIPISISLNFCR